MLEQDQVGAIEGEESKTSDLGLSIFIFNLFMFILFSTLSSYLLNILEKINEMIIIRFTRNHQMNSTV